MYICSENQPLKQIIMGKFEITSRKNGEFQFNLKATNGQVILTSQGYKTKASCLNGVESVKKNSQDDKRFEVKVSYASETTMENGIASVKRNAPEAAIVDLTEA